MFFFSFVIYLICSLLVFESNFFSYFSGLNIYIYIHTQYILQPSDTAFQNVLYLT